MSCSHFFTSINLVLARKFPIFASMRMLLIYILFVAFGCQQTTVNGQQTFSETENLRTVESENSLANDKSLKAKGNVQKFSASQVLNFSDSKKSSQVFSSSDSQVFSSSDSQVLSFSDSQVLSSSDSQFFSFSASQVLSFSDSKKSSQFFSFSDSQIQYYENQIRLADSLYKNYLPQYNFDEVKAAMEFFDSCQLSAISRQRWRLFSKEADEGNRLIAESRQLTAAKAHYYHAVGLTERDDIVGACEHYLTALEIMEELMADDEGQKAKGSKRNAECCQLSNEDYEKVRFVSLLYTRLGELFHNEGYCNLAIVKYRKALRYVEILGNNESKSQIMKAIGNSYQLLNNPDSSLYFYNESLQTSSNFINTLDVEKCIAHLLFEKGEKDSAYLLIKNNLDKIDNINVRYSYYNTLGEMYMKDIEYDSAIYYFDKSINSNIPSIKVTAVINLSAIYDSIDDYTKKAYYDNIISKISIKDINKSLETNKLQDVYDKYKKRKVEKERIESRKRVKIVVSSFTVVVFLSIFIIMLIWHKFNRNDKKYSDLLEVKEKYIAIKEKTIDRISKEIEHKESEIKKHIEIIEVHKSDINFLKNELSTKEQEISSKDADIKKMENDLSAKKAELARLQDNVNENEIKINKINKDNRTKEKQIYAYIEEIGKLKTEIDEARNNLTDIKFRNSLIEGKIKSANDKLKKNEEEINKYKLEISDFRNKLDIISSSINNSNYNPSYTGLELYLQSNVCSKILNEINNLSARNRDTNALTPLKPEEFVMLLNSASLYINNFSNGIISKYSKLKKEDLYYLSLAIIDLKDKQISSLLGVTYNSIRIRKKNICSMLGIKNNELKSFLMNICS